MKYDYSPIIVEMSGVKTYITYEWLKDLYGKSLDVSVLFAEPENDTELFELFSHKLWRLNNLYRIVDKDGNRVWFKMNAMQHKIFMVKKVVASRVILLKSRQIGGSTFASIDYLDDAITIDDLSIGLMAQGKEESATLLSRLKLAWEEFPTWAKEFLCVSLLRDNRTEFEFDNGSKVFIRTSFRSATLQRLWISEFAKISVKYPVKALETKTGTMQAIKTGNPILIESTAERGGLYQEMWEEAYNRSGEPSGKDFAALFIGWTEDPTCTLDVPQVMPTEITEYLDDIEIQLGITLTDEQRWFYASQARELKDHIKQEYPSTPIEAFMAAKDGSYYAKLYRSHILANGRVTSGLYDPNLEVNISMDLGINDDCTMVWFQTDRQGRRSIVNAYVNSGEALDHYYDVIVRLGVKNKYNYNTLYLPHDAKQRDKVSGYSAVRMMRKLVGLSRLIKIKVLKRGSVTSGIELVRQMIENLWIEESLVDVKEALLNYSKEWDEKTGTWKDKPKHDKYSHMADAIRYMAMSSKKESGDVNIKKKKGSKITRLWSS